MLRLAAVRHASADAERSARLTRYSPCCARAGSGTNRRSLALAELSRRLADDIG
jgi:hypothetical protein